MNDSTTKITVKNDGSLSVEGDFQIFDANGNPFDLSGRTKVSLCRCGATKNAPFCDGAHKGCEFKSTVIACKLPPKA